MFDTLREYLLEEPHLYLDEMAIFLWDEFEVLVTKSSISRALSSIGWSKEAARRVAKEQNPDLRGFYFITSRLSAHITSYTWVSLAVTNGLASDGLVGLPSA